MVSGNCIISGATLNHSLLFTGVLVRSYSTVTNSVILPEVIIHRNAHLSNVVVDRGVVIPEGMVIGKTRNWMPNASAAPAKAFAW